MFPASELRDMAFEIKRDVLLQAFLCSLLTVFMLGHGTDIDISCLKSIKDSLEGPFNYLWSWNFNNQTEGFICRFSGVECWNIGESRVLNLKLSNMGLKGQFPRGLKNCSSLTGLDLSLNDLTGPIPSDISSLIPFVTTIDLSYNRFNGEIPVALANCTFMNTLKLDNNMLTGQIPQKLEQLPRIKTISLANNHLSGQVPVFFNREVLVNYANNDGLCGEPSLPLCSLKNSTDSHQSFKEGLTVGYVFSFTSVIIAYMSYSYCAPCGHLRQEKNKHPNKAKELGKYICFITRRKTRSVADQMRQFLFLQLAEKENKEISVLMERLTSTLSFEELHDATDSFAIDNAIGVGKMGIMYQGRLLNGQFIAIKRLFHSHLFKRQFLSELIILGKYTHRNIMPLLGFCNEEKEKILVYQHMSNGRLSKWLQPLESEVVRLKWPDRFNIALGIARGLAWLHHECDLHIVHLSICSECILLDENFEPIISNFGEAKFMNPNTEDGLGLMFKVNDGKKDVYDFGSVLFELITGKTYNELSRSSSITNLCGNPSNFYNAINKSLIGEGFENEVCALLRVACECVQPLPDQRPAMLQVYNNVSHIRKGRHGFSDDSDTTRELETGPVTIRGEITEL